tara:strand:+ start:1989 stop:2285 length:297 start_codon:yes stop_codon:yes gene_type:complete
MNKLEKKINQVSTLPRFSYDIYNVDRMSSPRDDSRLVEACGFLPANSYILGKHNYFCSAGSNFSNIHDSSMEQPHTSFRWIDYIDGEHIFVIVLSGST